MDDQTRCVIDPAVSTSGYDSLAVPVCRASTIPFASAADYFGRFDRGDDGYVYGLYGTPTARVLEKKISLLHGGTRTFLLPSGQAAVALPMIAVLAPGQSVLIPDTVYPPVRDFATTDLARMGVQPRFYDPTDIQALAALIDQTTRLIWLESPGSTTMEVQDLPAIVSLASDRGILTGCDNTWATALLLKPLAHGVDMVAEALTKYPGGHADLLMGSITVRDNDLAGSLKGALGRLGVGCSPDDCALVLRGLQTMPLRLAHAGTTAERLARWIAAQPAVSQVLHPALPDFPFHRLWQRDFQGASGVFSVVLNEAAIPYVATAFDELRVFAIGGSWGSTRSLLVPMTIRNQRTVRPWAEPEPVLRLSIGVEAEEALQEDLDRFFAILNPHCAAPDGRGRLE